MDEKTNEIGENMNENMGAVKFDPVLQRILDKLQERGYTGKQLETHLKLTNGSVTKWKIRNGKSYFRHIVEIAEFLGTTPSYLLDGNMLELGDLTIEERGKKLCDEMSEYIRKIKASGELDAIHSIWQGADEAAKIPPDFKNLPAKNGTVTYAAEGSYPPFTYYKGNELAGIDIDIVVRFCKAYGYGLNVQTMFFDAMLPAVNSGKIDFAGDFTPSEEHEEAVYFSESYCEAHSLMACLRAEKQTAWSLDEGHDAAYDNDDEPSFWEDVASSFNKTFIREKRWELFIHINFE